VYLFSDDTSIVGTSFYIMQFMQGHIFDDPIMEGNAARGGGGGS
jgi:hypothetical protein